jgi:hypothetical protein
MIGLRHAVFMQKTMGHTCAQNVNETIYGWQEFDDNVDFLPQPEREKLDKLVDLMVASWHQFVWPPYRIVKIVGHADKTWHDRSGVPLTQSTEYEYSVGINRAHAVRAYLRDKTLPLLKDAPRGHIDWTALTDGSKHLIARPYDPRNRRVEVLLVCDGPPLPLNTETKVVDITAKSFIALIGSRTGSIPGMTTITPPPPAPPVPIPISRQTLLETQAKIVDAMMKEDPKSIAKDKGYRLFSNCRFTVVFENKKILAATPSELDTDTGKEGPLQAPPLTTTPVKVSPTGGNSVTFSWFGKGRPHPAAEPGFQEVQPRTSVFIWHEINGTFDVSTGELVTTVAIRGSQFPSHRVFIGADLKAEVTQGVFSNLWVADPADNTLVK